LFWRRCSLRPRGICGHERATATACYPPGNTPGSRPRPLDVPTMAARPHPGPALRADCIEAEDAAHNDAVFEYVVGVLVVSNRRAFED
jgi:hypothetical protein